MTAAKGSASTARLAVGDWESVDEISDIWRIDHDSDREMVAKEADVMYPWWGEAVERSLVGGD